MPNSQLHTAISYPRFSRYLHACDNNRRKALQLYRANILLSQKLYAVIGVFEVILRNSIDRHFLEKKGNNWLANAIKPGGYLEGKIGCEFSYQSIHDAEHKLGRNCNHDKLITALSFGFWTYQFATKQYAAAGSTLLEIFQDRPFGTRQKEVFKILVKINDIRNRIAHYEPICFDKNTGNISTLFVEKRYNLILEILQWLGCKPARILYGIDNVPKGIENINMLCPTVKRPLIEALNLSSPSQSSTV